MLAELIPCHVEKSSPEVQCFSEDEYDDWIAAESLDMYFIEKATQLSNYTHPLRDIIRPINLASSYETLVEIATNNLILEQDKIGFLTTKRTE